MREVDTSDFNKVFPLYSDWEHHMSLQAAAEGQVDAQVWANSVDSPAAAVICFGYRVLIGGDPENLLARNEIRDFFHNIVLQNKIISLNHFFMLFWNEPGWQDVMLDTLKGCNMYLREREYYGADLHMNMNSPVLPAAYELRTVDRSFLDECAWINKDELLDEMCSERASVEDFLEHSFGVCAVLGDEITGWCLSEYNNSCGCEVGIEVLQGHKRKGIGTALTHALMEKAGSQGLKRFGWSCFKDNLPSSATASKAGLTKLEEYNVILVHR